VKSSIGSSAASVIGSSMGASIGNFIGNIFIPGAGGFVGSLIGGIICGVIASYGADYLIDPQSQNLDLFEQIEVSEEDKRKSYDRSCDIIGVFPGAARDKIKEKVRI
jgi:outer membrane lipoprotein SlyB